MTQSNVTEHIHLLTAKVKFLVRFDFGEEDSPLSAERSVGSIRS